MVTKAKIYNLKEYKVKKKVLERRRILNKFIKHAESLDWREK